MKPLTLLATAAAILATSIPASAHNPKPLENTLERQIGRIHEARHIGDLTWLEKRALLREQRRIARHLAEIKADGVVTRSEYRSVRNEQRAARMHINRERSDSQIARWKRFLSSYNTPKRSQY